MEPKTERFEMRLDPRTLETVDAWRGRQSDRPSRAEAIRRLVDTGLSQPFSDGEKLILIMLGEVYKHLKIKGDIDPAFVAEAIHGGHYWGLRWKYSGIFHGHEDNERVVSEVVDVLDMWSFIEGGYGELSQKDKAVVAKQAAPFGEHVQFPGFDGNNEAEHLGIAHFLIDDLERFSRFKGRRDLNSHVPSIETYRRMFRVFEPMRRTLIMGRELGVTEIIELLKAKRHPSHSDTADG
jgi:uncharacterized protein